MKMCPNEGGMVCVAISPDGGMAQVSVILNERGVAYVTAITSEGSVA